jgi:hypothetical protein
MMRDLERRLNLVEARQLVSQRVAAVLRMIDTMSEQEFLDQMAAPSGIFDPRTMTDAELGCLIVEFFELRDNVALINRDPIDPGP